MMGLDLSLRGAALVVLGRRWVPGYWGHVLWERFTEAGELEGDERVAAIVGGVLGHMTDVRDVFVEEHAFAMSAMKHAFARAELVGAVKRAVYEHHGIRVVPVVASSARKLLFGKLPKMNREEIKATIRSGMEMMGSPLPDEDTRDAFIIANAGRYKLGLSCLAWGEPT